MKIISKYKDFYDYMAPDFDSDNVYVRKFDVITDKTICSDVRGTIEKIFKFTLPYDRFFYGRLDTIYTYPVIYGIYPYVYSVMAIEFGKSFFHIFTREEFDKIIAEKDFRNVIKNFLIKNGFDKKAVNEAIMWNYKAKDTFINGFSRIENTDVFKQINSPVFLYYYWGASFLMPYNNVYYNELSRCGCARGSVLSNISFQKLDVDIIAPFADLLYDLNTCIGIENFLYSSKQEPIAEPDNKTKIINHGFDTKTSFRKVNYPPPKGRGIFAQIFMK